MTTVHLLKANGHDEAPFADYTLCGESCTEVHAMWPGERLNGRDSWGHRIPGKWCQTCKSLEKAALEEMHHADQS